MTLFNNFYIKNTPYDLKSMAQILEASYSEADNKDELVTKTGFSPSQIGYGSGVCARRWNLLFNGAHFVSDYDSTSIDNMQNGTDRHERIQNNFANSELDIEIEKELWHEDPPIHCFVDAIIKNFNGHDIAVEIKTTRSEAYASRRAKNKGPDYQELQLLIYLYLLDLRYGVLLYENKNTHDKLLIPVELTPENKERVEKVFEWMREVYQSYVDKKLPENVFRSNSKVCKSCPVQKYCSEQPKGDIRIEPLDYAEVTHVVDW